MSHTCHQRNTQMLPVNHQEEMLVKDKCSYLHTYGKKLECYGKTMEKLWNFYSADLYEPCKIVQKVSNIVSRLLILLLCSLDLDLNLVIFNVTNRRKVGF